MSDHRQDDQWDKALREHPPITTGRLDMASYTIDGEQIRYLYCDAWPERIAITGDQCDFIAYAANRAQPLMAEVERLRAENETMQATIAEARRILATQQHWSMAPGITSMLRDLIAQPNDKDQAAP